MSVLKNLRSIFIVEEENGPAKTDPQSPESGDQPPEPGPGFTSEEVPIEVGDGQQDDKIINTLFEAIEKNNLSGFDYIEFKKSVKGLEKMVVDEATRFKSAFATASTMGVTMDKLVESAGYYIKILDKERSQFVQAAEQQTTSLVENRKKEMQMLLKSMADKKELIEKLTKELATSESKLKTIQDGIDSATVRISQTKKNFDVSFTYLREQISDDIQKIQNFLK